MEDPEAVAGPLLWLSHSSTLDSIRFIKLANCHVGRHRQADPEMRNKTNRLQRNGWGTGEAFSLTKLWEAHSNEVHQGQKSLQKSPSSASMLWDQRPSKEGSATPTNMQGD